MPENAGKPTTLAGKVAGAKLGQAIDKAADGKGKVNNKENQDEVNKRP
jgi:hypothetical protein